MTRAGWVAVLAIGCRFESTGVGGETVFVDATPRDSFVPDTFVADTTVDTFEAPPERYFALEGVSDWYVARDRCKDRGAHLVTITSAEELATVKALVTADTWLGLRKSSVGAFEWITGEPFTLDGWKPGEPSGSGSCGKIEGEGDWLDHSCLEPLVPLCERD